MTKRRVFITMRSTSSMTIFDWERHVEELQAAVGGTVGQENWDEVAIYGPNTGGFSPPAMCIEATMGTGELSDFLARLSKTAPWMSVPVNVYFDASKVNDVEISEV